LATALSFHSTVIVAPPSHGPTFDVALRKVTPPEKSSATAQKVIIFRKILSLISTFSRETVNFFEKLLIHLRNKQIFNSTPEIGMKLTCRLRGTLTVKTIFHSWRQIAKPSLPLTHRPSPIDSSSVCNKVISKLTKFPAFSTAPADLMSGYRNECSGSHLFDGMSANTILRPPDLSLFSGGPSRLSVANLSRRHSENGRRCNNGPHLPVASVTLSLIGRSNRSAPFVCGSCGTDLRTF
jgi:hypothetical protein